MLRFAAAAACSLLSFTALRAQGGETLRVLFIGNSYTYVNNMPQIVADMAAAGGDTLIWESSTPGGYTFMQHSTDATTINKIKKGNWDYVVLQGQSQRPAMPDGEANANVLPYARKLDSLVELYNGCGKTMFYMTWGRKDGDMDNCFWWPKVCTYEEMDSLLHARYMLMATQNKAEVSPVGAVWRYVRENHPSIELYDTDWSHPSRAGSFVAASSFYTALFRKDPSKLSYNYSLSATDAGAIKNAAKKVVYDSMAKWSIGAYTINAAFTVSKDTGIKFRFSNKSVNASSYNWSFGDGNTATTASPVHTYASKGTYTVRLVATSGSCSDTSFATVQAFPTGIADVLPEGGQFQIAPNPAQDVLVVSSDMFAVGSLSIHIYDLAGRVVHHVAAGMAKSRQLDLSGFSKGVYIISVEQEGRSLYRSRFIKN